MDPVTLTSIFKLTRLAKLFKVARLTAVWRLKRLKQLFKVFRLRGRSTPVEINTIIGSVNAKVIISGDALLDPDACIIQSKGLTT